MTSTALQGVLARAADPEQWERFERQLRSTGYCRRPVRLKGRVDSVDPATGEIVRTYSTEGEPTGRCSSAAATGARRCARRARRSIAATPSNSSRAECAAARACPRPSSSIRWCS